VKKTKREHKPHSKETLLKMSKAHSKRKTKGYTKNHNKFMVKFRWFGETIRLGAFYSEQEAIDAVSKWRKDHD
jgi:hypothetical protein